MWEMRGEADVARRAQIGGRPQRGKSRPGEIKRRNEEKFIKLSRTSQERCTPSIWHATLASENLIILITVLGSGGGGGRHHLNCGGLGAPPNNGKSL